MVFKPLSDARHQPLGASTKATSSADDEVEDLPGGVYFSGKRAGEPEGGDAGLYYKNGTGGIRRVRFTRSSKFEFAVVPEDAHFEAVADILVVPEVDPRAWVAAREKVAKAPEQIATLKPGSFFTALGASEDSSWNRRGVYRLGRDGMIRRMLKEPSQGLKWSDAIPADRLGDFGARLAVSEE